MVVFEEGQQVIFCHQRLEGRGGILAMSQGLLEARVAKVLAGIACTNFNNLCLRYFSCRRFEMIGSADVGREGKS